MVATGNLSPAALLITGSVGAGKTCVAELVGERLAAGTVRLVLAGVVETHAEPSWTATWKPSACHWRFAAFGSPCRCARPAEHAA